MAQEGEALGTFNRVAAVAMGVLALQACSNNPTVSAGASIEEFARNLNGKQYSFDLTGKRFRSEDSAEPVTPLRIPKGLALGLDPAQDYCKRASGEPSLLNIVEATPHALVKVNLPQRILCLRNGTPLWVLDIQYVAVRAISSYDSTLNARLWDLRMGLQTQLLSPDQYAARLKDEQAQAQARDRAAEVQKERQAALEQERQQRARAQEAEARKLAAERPARVAAFQANVKAGDRFQWARAPGGGGPYVGMVVRIEGVMAFVQFDNLTISGQSTRYLPKVELEPFDGPTPNFRRSID